MIVVRQHSDDLKKFTAYGTNVVGNDFSMEQYRDTINEIATWCKETFGNDYETWNIDNSGSTFIIDNEEDIVAFKLRWL